MSSVPVLVSFALDVVVRSQGSHRHPKGHEISLEDLWHVVLNFCVQLPTKTNYSGERQLGRSTTLPVDAVRVFEKIR